MGQHGNITNITYKWGGICLIGWGIPSSVHIKQPPPETVMDVGDEITLLGASNGAVEH